MFAAGIMQTGSSLFGVALTIVYFAALGIASVYGVHRYWLVIRYWRTRNQSPGVPRRFDELPHVTVQLPMFNEAAVAERVIDAACRIDYPREKLQIQVLDDSTDESAAIARHCVRKWHQRGVTIEYRHRTDRTGYKAGALQAGLESAIGEYLAVFDADFVPPCEYLNRVIHHFTDKRVAMVQAAWDHLNRKSSLLTRCQAIYLDSHFQIEHAARHRDGNWFNFNGTAGIWRREAIQSAGGWQHDTLTEDMDLSYRAQLAGWQFIYRQDVDCPAELPPETVAFKTQQHRWTKGTVQTAMKLLPRILRSDASRSRKIEAAFHLTSPIVYPCVIVIALLMLPAVVVNLKPFEQGSLSAGLLGLMILLLATASGVTFYVAGQIVRRVALLRTMLHIPPLVVLGIGMSINNALAVVEALLGRESAFVRTPKYNLTQRRRVGDPPWRDRRERKNNSVYLSKSRISALSAPLRAILSPRRETFSTILELTIGVYLTLCLLWAMRGGPAIWVSPFLLLFASGYLYVGLTSIHWPNCRTQQPSSVCSRDILELPQQSPKEQTVA